VLLKRILSALIGIPLFVLVIYKGGIYLLLTVFILAILALLEFKNIIKKSECKVFPVLLWMGAFLIPLEYMIENKYIVYAIIFYFVFCLLFYIFYFPKYTPIDLSFTLFGAMYVSLGFFHLLLLRNLQFGFWLVIYVFVIVWSTDTGAYFIGSYLGKHKLAPALSPSKSWEGFFGGLVVSTLMVYLFNRSVSITGEGTLMLIAPIVSIAGQLGDLFESSLKRFAKIKDSSNIIPGHGGILDRFDSTLWAAPVTYYLFILIERLV